MSFNLFVYGSLKNPLLFQTVTGIVCPYKQEAVLQDYGVCATYLGYPVISRMNGHNVTGELIVGVPDEALNELDEYEGVNSEGRYCRLLVIVESGGEQLQAFAYVGK